MEKIKIVTDSTADLPIEIVKEYDIGVIPLLVTIEDKIYKDGVDINLYKLLEKVKTIDNFPTTSQINPQRFVQYYKKYLDEGYKIVALHLSSKMSGTYQSACIAKEMLDTNDIEVIDTQNVTSGLGILVIKACKLKEKGLNIKEIKREIIKAIPHVKSILVFQTLDNLVKGGRLSKTAGIIGNILGIKPILAVEDGEMKVKGKVRGNKKAVRMVLDYLDKVGIKQDEMSVLLHVNNKDILGTLREKLKSKNHNFIECTVGCVVGIYAGKGACGVFFIENY